MRGDGRVFKPIRRGKETAYWYLAYWGPREGGTWGEIRESSHERIKEKAEKMLRDRIRKIHNHRQGLERFLGPRQDRVTVNEILDALILDYETREKKSLRTTRAHLAHVREAFGTDLAVSVTADRVKRFIAMRRSEKAAKATIDRETEILGRAFSLAIQDGRLAFKPPIPKLLKAHENARQGFFERADFEKVMENIEDPDIKDFLWWFYFTGMRPGEIRSLTWHGFDRETWTLRLHASDAKTGFGRVLALTHEWRTIIERRLAARRPGCDLIFHRGGRPVGRFSKLWKAVCEKAEISGRRPYDLRRTAVRNLRLAGVSEKVIMAISGHRTRSMFDRYNIVSEEDLRDAARMVTDYVASLPATRNAPATVTPIENSATSRQRSS